MSHSSWSNDQLTELTIPQGATSGERITINVGQDGAILVYDTGGHLIASLAPIAGTAADATAYSPGLETFTAATGETTSVQGGQILFNDAAGNPNNDAVIGYTPEGGHAYDLFLDSGLGSGAQTTVSRLDLNSSGTGHGAYIGATQDVPAGTSLDGTVIMNDDSTGFAQAKAMHTGRYSATVSGAAGLATFNHNAGFTPTFGVFTLLTNASQGNWSDAFGVHGFTSTQAQVVLYVPGGGFVGNGATCTLYALFMA